MPRRGEVLKTLGIIGGIAPGSTVDYYRLLIASYLRLLKSLASER